MKADGRLEQWNVYGARIVGRMFDYENQDFFPNNSPVEFNIVTEPPFFKTRIITSRMGRFYVLGEPADKEFEIV